MATHAEAAASTASPSRMAPSRPKRRTATGPVTDALAMPAASAVPTRPADAAGTPRSSAMTGATGPARYTNEAHAPDAA